MNARILVCNERLKKRYEEMGEKWPFNRDSYFFLLLVFSQSSERLCERFPLEVHGDLGELIRVRRIWILFIVLWIALFLIGIPVEMLVIRPALGI